MWSRGKWQEEVESWVKPTSTLQRGKKNNPKHSADTWQHVGGGGCWCRLCCLVTVPKWSRANRNRKKGKKEKLEAPLAWSWQTCTGKTKQSNYLSWWLIKTDDSYVIQAFSCEAGSSLTVFMHLVTVSGARVSLSGLLLKGCNTSWWFLFSNLVPHSKSKNESGSLSLWLDAAHSLLFHSGLKTRCLVRGL